ncbi:MAG: response regulator [Mariprofundaceae bacterium]|nr:response regulator [Mariprofundaceae bacterium]
MIHSTPANNAYVIIVDDDPLILSLLVCLIEKNGLIARGFTSPAEALQTIGSQTVCPDLLISDYDMGPINGLSLIEKSRNHFPDLACILISGNDAVGRNFLPRNTHFIGKPFRARALWFVVNNLLQKD